MSIATSTTDVDILAAVIAPERDHLSPEAARFFLKLIFSEAQNVEMRMLADKNNRGELTEAERAVMESYRRVGQFLAIMQAKARLALNHSGSQDL
jgi:hypothetical protein